METETKIDGAPVGEYPGSVVRMSGLHLRASREMLQAIVQAAYDQHGIVAQPSYVVEALNAPPASAVLAESEYAIARAETDAALQAVHNVGVRA